MEWIRHGFSAVVLALVLARLSMAQEVEADPAPMEKIQEPAKISRILTRLDYTHGRVHIDRDGPSYRVTITGGFKLSYGKRNIEAENAVLWLERKELFEKFSSDEEDIGNEESQNLEEPLPEAPNRDDSEPEAPQQETLSPDEDLVEPVGEVDENDSFVGDVIERIYAEGFIRYENGLEVIEADRAYFDLKRHRGLVLNSVIRAPIPVVPPTSVVIRAARLQQVSETAYRGYNTSLTTSSHADPHYYLRSAVVSFENLDKGVEEDVQIRAEGNSFVLAEQMLTPLPTANYNLTEDVPVPIRSIALGRSNQYGVFFLSRWGQDIDDLGRGFNDLLGIEEEFSGEWFADVNFYSRRGLGVGGGLEWKTRDVYEGFLETFYIDDRLDEDGDGTLVENNDRGRVLWRNRAWFGEGWRLDTELSYISEANFLNEYYEQEAKEGKEQETYAYLRKLWDTEGFTLLSRHRLNDFDSQTEYLPRAAFRSVGRELFSLNDDQSASVYHTNFSELSHVRRLASDQLDGTPFDFSSERLVRADTVDRFDLPVQFGRYTFSPFYENRLSWFERSIERGDKATSRYAGTAGARMATQLHRTFDVQNESLGINGIRHIVIPEVQYRNTFALSRGSEDLISIDTVENVDRFQVILLRLEQRFQTRHSNQPDADIFNFFSLEFEQPIFPDEDRDNGGETFGNLFAEAFLKTKIDLYPIKDLTLLSRTEWDWDAQGLDRSQITLAGGVLPGWRARASLRGVRGAFEIFTFGSIYRVSPKWEFDVLEQRDIREGLLLERRFGVRRFGNDWVVGLYLAVDEGENDRSISLSLSPLFLYQDPRGAGTGPYGEPFFDPDLNL